MTCKSACTWGLDDEDRQGNALLTGLTHVDSVFESFRYSLQDLHNKSPVATTKLAARG